ncbi:ribosome hibernation-promoting factor, HPF/YfiA family [Winogradskyella psychrotolerans]|uniref:ribosome hibernation-promoting factor, HPF/YfiA family n=1 Tax=Winogradskyella psychrotolerans TaxID=1344585 RepID=UPI001C06F90D|nr:ribosome-associated translation inhibitor RaiA [Winogradskyella psychrotolerans]MBU2927194.1 ribosome-associated translation inhibitor RaiA [Winogradskyella psychrotolerans]
MEIIFEYHDIETSDRLEAHAKEKLETVFTRYDFVIRTDVFFKTENTTRDDTGKICSIRLSAPGPRLFAESSHENFYDAISETVNDLLRQLEKRKDKMKTY